jgi:NTE family protein
MTTAFVLSGGGSLGAMQVGMLRALLRAGIRPDHIYGTSIGSLNGAALAIDPTPGGVERLARLWHDIGQHDVYPLDLRQGARAVVQSLPWLPVGLLRATGALNRAFPVRPLTAIAGLVGLTDHAVPSGPEARLLRSIVGTRRIEDTLVSFEAECAEVTSGRLVSLTSGDAVPALLASTAIPGVFPPQRVGEHLLMDGGVADNTALDRALEHGATEVYVLPTGFSCDLPAAPRSALGMAVHGLSVLIEQRLISAVHRTDPRVPVHVVPPLCPVTVVPVDFGSSDKLIADAERATEQWLTNGHQPVEGLSRALGDHGVESPVDLTTPDRPAPRQV